MGVGAALLVVVVVRVAREGTVVFSAELAQSAARGRLRRGPGKGGRLAERVGTVAALADGLDGALSRPDGGGLLLVWRQQQQWRLWGGRVQPGFLPASLCLASHLVADAQWGHGAGQHEEGRDLGILLVQHVRLPQMGIHGPGPLGLAGATAALGLLGLLALTLAFAFGLGDQLAVGRDREDVAVGLGRLSLGGVVIAALLILDAGATAAGSAIVGRVAVDRRVGRARVGGAGRAGAGDGHSGMQHRNIDGAVAIPAAVVVVVVAVAAAAAATKRGTELRNWRSGRAEKALGLGGARQGRSHGRRGRLARVAAEEVCGWRHEEGGSVRSFRRHVATGRLGAGHDAICREEFWLLKKDDLCVDMYCSRL